MNDATAKKQLSPSEAIGVAFWMLIGSTFGVVLRGFVIMKLWGWFIVPTIRAYPLTIAQGVGIHIFIALLVRQFNETPEFDKKPATERWMLLAMRSVAASLFFWALGAFAFWWETQ